VLIETLHTAETGVFTDQFKHRCAIFS